MPSASWGKAGAAATAVGVGNGAAATSHLHRWEQWSGAVDKRVAAQAQGKTYRSYLRLGEEVAADRSTRPSEGQDNSPSPTTRSYIGQGESLRDMIAKDAPRTLFDRDHDDELTAEERVHIQSVTNVLTALFGGRLSTLQYRQGISIVVAFLLTVARRSAAARGRDTIGAAQVARDESMVFWLVSAVVEDVYPLLLDAQLLLAETALTWQLLRRCLPEAADHLTTLFGDAEAAEAGFGGLFITKFLQTLCVDQFPHDTACQIWDILLVSHFSCPSEPEPEPEPAAEHQPVAGSAQPAAQPFAAMYTCVAKTKVSAALHEKAWHTSVVTLEPGSTVEVVEQCAVPALGCVRLRVGSVAMAAKAEAARNGAQRSVHFVHKDCGGWITKPGTEPAGQPSCFIALEREATCAMLPQVVLAFIAMHSDAILATNDLSQLLGMGGSSVLRKCKEQTRSVGAVVRAANRLGLTEVTTVAHRIHCRTECLAVAEAQQVEFARKRRLERLAKAKSRTNHQEQGRQLSPSKESLRFSLLPADARGGDRDSTRQGSTSENPMLATVRWFGRSTAERAAAPTMHRSNRSTFSSHGLGGSSARVDGTACIALFSGSLKLGLRDSDAVDGPDDLLQVDESKCLGGCLGQGNHHIKCPNYQIACQRELQLERWRQADHESSSSPTPPRPSGASRHAVQVVAAVPPSAATRLHGGERRYKGKAVVILRGEVDFMTKQRHAAAAGAAAVVFVNLEEDAPFLAFPRLDEDTDTGEGAETSYSKIPAVCVGRSDGEALLAAVQRPISTMDSDASDTNSISSVSSVSSPSESVDGHRKEEGDVVWLEIRRHASQQAVKQWQQATIQEAQLRQHRRQVQKRM